jgi:hypothetical protein
VVVRFTPEELASVSVRAVAAGLTVPSYLALSGLRPEGVAAADAKSALTNIAGVRRLLAGATTNLNQLTRKLHSTGEVDESLGAVAAAVERYAARADEVAGVLGVLVGGGRR